MSRLSEAILKGAYADTGSTNAPMTNLLYGGQHGWSPNMTQWHSNQAYITRPLVCIVLEFPKMFNYMPNPEKWKQSIKALFETHAKSIDGFNAGLTVDTEEHAVGGAGEMQQEVVNVTRERSQPSFGFTEKYGRPIQNLLEYWIRYGLMDPDTKTALLGTMGRAEVQDMLADWYSATCLFFEPDPLHKNVTKAWITTNMFPTSTGPIEGKRDLTASQEMLDLSIEFTGLSQYGNAVTAFAQTILDKINIAGGDPYTHGTYLNGITADVSSIKETGYDYTIAQSEASGKTTAEAAAEKSSST